MKVFKDVPINKIIEDDIIRPVKKFVVTKTDSQNVWLNGVQISNNDFYFLFGDWEIERRNHMEIINDAFKDRTKEFEAVQEEYNKYFDSFHKNYILGKRNPDDEIKDPHQK